MNVVEDTTIFLDDIKCFARVKNTLKAFDDVKSKQKSVKSNVFIYVKIVYSESLFNTLYIDIKHKF